MSRVCVDFTFWPQWPIMEEDVICGLYMRKLLLILLGVACWGQPAAAHPHLYATMQTTVMTTADGKISGLRLRWSFDETYTQYSLEGLDLNQNGTYEPEEIQPLTDENIKNLIESKYFTFAKAANSEVPQKAVTIYGQDMVDDKLNLWFELPFATPVDPKLGAVEVRIYDPDFFIAFDYAADKPPTLEGQLPQGCSMDLKQLPSNEESEQTRAMLSDKPQDWKPEQPTDFGAMFAQPLVITCT
jgi:ABC-type uncharacterized transport system substrate-binding protein